MKVTKRDIVKYISENCGKDEYGYILDNFEIQTGIDKLIDIIENYIAQDHTIEIRHFGTFIPRKRKARVARVPKKGGKEVPLPERYVPVIKFSGLMKNEVIQSQK